MGKRTFLTCVIISNVSFILILLHKRHALTESLYSKQRLEYEAHLLTKEMHALQHELSTLQDRAMIKTYAQTYLHMAPITLSQMKKLST